MSPEVAATPRGFGGLTRTVRGRSRKLVEKGHQDGDDGGEKTSASKQERD